MKASILIPAYRHHYFEDALTSAINQIAGVGEIIVSDDSPSNKIRKITEDLSKNSNVPIVYIRNKTPLGEAKNFLQTVKIASFPYIKPLHDDDVLHPNCTARLVEVLEEHDNISLATVRRNLINAKGEDIGGINYPLSFGNLCIKNNSILSLLARDAINWFGEPSCILFRRENCLSFGELFFTLEGLLTPGCGDLASCVNLLNLGDLGLLPDLLVSHRLSNYSQSAAFRLSEKDSGISSYSGLEVIKNYLEKYGYPKEAAGDLVAAPLVYPLIFQKYTFL